MQTRTIGIIPARYGSTRFEGMIQRVYERASKATKLDKVVVATDDERIMEHVLQFGGECVMTSVDCMNGTERCAEALSKMTEHYNFVINIQGDEPFIYPEQIDAVVEVLEKNEDFEVATLVRRIKSLEELNNTSVVKAVVAFTNKALYFSRQAIPFVRGVAAKNILKHNTFYKHIGLYGYKASVLPKLAQLEATNLEKLESLEQLRWLENNISIGVSETQYDTVGVDMPIDLQKAIELAKRLDYIK
jgi:3-deoxy-manno-octulosonate cytidylyltransferase (CMP-KDO synthetase)